VTERQQEQALGDHVAAGIVLRHAVEQRREARLGAQLVLRLCTIQPRVVRQAMARRLALQPRHDLVGFGVAVVLEGGLAREIQSRSAQIVALAMVDQVAHAALRARALLEVEQRLGLDQARLAGDGAVRVGAEIGEQRLHQGAGLFGTRGIAERLGAGQQVLGAELPLARLHGLRQGLEQPALERVGVAAAGSPGRIDDQRTHVREHSEQLLRARHGRAGDRGARQHCRRCHCRRRRCRRCRRSDDGRCSGDRGQSCRRPSIAARSLRGHLIHEQVRDAKGLSRPAEGLARLRAKQARALQALRRVTATTGQLREQPARAGVSAGVLRHTAQRPLRTIPVRQREQRAAEPERGIVRERPGAGRGVLIGGRSAQQIARPLAQRAQ
jgi:hypothetical protein